MAEWIWDRFWRWILIHQGKLISLGDGIGGKQVGEQIPPMSQASLQSCYFSFPVWSSFSEYLTTSSYSQRPHTGEHTIQSCPSRTFKVGQDFVYNLPVLTFPPMKEWPMAGDISKIFWSQMLGSFFLKAKPPFHLRPQRLGARVRGKKLFGRETHGLWLLRVQQYVFMLDIFFSCLAYFQFLKVFSSNKLWEKNHFANFNN